MALSLENQIADAAAFLHRKRIASASNSVISAVDRTNGILALNSGRGSVHGNLCFYSLDDADALYNDENAGFHIKLYRRFTGIGSIILLRSYYVSLFAQSQLPVMRLEIRGGRLFNDDIPCSAPVSSFSEISDAVTRMYESISSDPSDIPAVIVPPVGAVVFGTSPSEAAEYAYILENTAMYRYRISELNLNNTDVFDLLNRYDVKRKIIEKLSAE